jgi:hypothetical protein
MPFVSGRNLDPYTGSRQFVGHGPYRLVNGIADPADHFRRIVVGDQRTDPIRFDSPESYGIGLNGAADPGRFWGDRRGARSRNGPPERSVPMQSHAIGTFLRSQRLTRHTRLLR